MENLSIIEESHAAKVLVLCLQEGEIAKGIVYQKLQKNTTVLQSRIKQLVDAGLLSEELQKRDGTQARILTLTPRGRRVAEHLKAIDGILSEK